MSFKPCHCIFSRPTLVDGVLHRGFVTTDLPTNLSDQLDPALWSVGLFYHAAIEPRAHPGIDLYFGCTSFARCPQPRIDITDRDLSDAESFFVRDDVEKEFDVVFNATWMPVKRHELAFEALQYAKQAGRSIQCLWFGYHYTEESEQREKQFRQLVAEHELDVTFLDTDFEVAEINRRFNSAHCTLICSKSEGGPRVFGESLLANVPIVVTRDTVGGAPQAIESTTGVTCEPTGQSIAEAIWKVKAEKRFDARRWALEHITRSKTVSRLQQSLKQLSSKSPDSPIHWQSLRFEGYDWQTANQVIRKAEQSFLQLS